MSERLIIAQLEEELARVKEDNRMKALIIADYAKHVNAMRTAARMVRDEIKYLTGEEW